MRCCRHVHCRSSTTTQANLHDLEQLRTPFEIPGLSAGSRSRTSLGLCLIRVPHARRGPRPNACISYHSRCYLHRQHFIGRSREFFYSFAHLLRLSRLERLLSRPQVQGEKYSRRFCEMITAWISKVRDDRVWLDVQLVIVRHPRHIRRFAGELRLSGVQAYSS